jgi:predicted permease
MTDWRWSASRLRALLQRRRREAALDEELQFHLEEEAERLMAEGQSADEAVRAARRSLGSPIAVREHTRDVWTWPALEQLTRDIRYGWRQLHRSKTRSAAAIVSLALALGACLATFVVMDALLFRPLPVDGANRLQVMVRTSAGADGPPRAFDGCEYPLYERIRDDLSGADVLGVSYASRADVSHDAGHALEKAYLQYASGNLFETFRLRPVAGRLFGPADDRVIGLHPLAVITESYWTRRFQRDPAVLGRSIRVGPTDFEIVGVVAAPFTGTEPGVGVDILLPGSMHPSALARGSTWLRLLTRVHPGVPPARIRDQLQAHLTAYQRDRSSEFVGLPPSSRDRLLNERAVLEPASTGVSTMQARYRDGLTAIAVLVGLVLLVACTNVGNLMIARTAARSRELALRVSLGAGRRSLLQLVLAESAWVAGLATVLGLGFAMLAAPLVVAQVNPPDDPARLALQFDVRAVAFATTLSGVTMLLFGLAPALVAMKVTPAAALRGGHTPRTHRRLMHGLVLVQVAFCFLVVFVGGLFVATLDRLAQQPLGFVPQRLLAVSVVSARPTPVGEFEAMVTALRDLPGVDMAALGDRALLDGGNWNNFISIDGAPPDDRRAFFRGITPGFLDTVRVPLLGGRDLRAGEQHPAVAVVNEAFSRTFFGGQNPVGRTFHLPNRLGELRPIAVVGLVRDARYSALREAVPPVAYVPFRDLDDAGLLRPRMTATIMVRTTVPDPLALSSLIRERVARQSSLAVSTLRTQEDVIAVQTVRERLLASIGTFFAGLALLLSAIGLFGVVDYAVVQRRRDIGIFLALGAPSAYVVKLVVLGVVSMALLGSLLGLLAGVASERYLASLLFEVSASDPASLLQPSVIVLVVVALACAGPVIRALRTDITATIRTQ